MPLCESALTEKSTDFAGDLKRWGLAIGNYGERSATVPHGLNSFALTVSLTLYIGFAIATLTLTCLMGIHVIRGAKY